MKVLSYELGGKICVSEGGLKPRFRYYFMNLKEIKEKLPGLLNINLETTIFASKEAEKILKDLKSVRDYTKKINAILKAYNM